MRCHLLLRVFATAISAAALASCVVLESLPGVPEGWQKLRDAPANGLIKLKIALKQPNLDLFEKTLYAVSDPQHVMYGKHLKRDELKEMMRPRPESTDAVLSWLGKAGVPSSMVEDDGDWINFKITVGQANKMLNTTLAVYGHDNVKTVRTLEYSVPSAVAAHITMIAPLIRFAHVKRMRSHVFEKIEDGFAPVSIQAANIPTPELNATQCNTTITPECLRALYKIGSYKAEPTKRSLFGVAGYLEVCHYLHTYLVYEYARLTCFRNMRDTTCLRSSRTHTPPTRKTSTSPWSRLTGVRTTRLTQSTTLARRIWTSSMRWASRTRRPSCTIPPAAEALLCQISSKEILHPCLLISLLICSLANPTR